MKGDPEGMQSREDRWSKVASVLREAGVVERVGKEVPPPGLVTRIVARSQADVRADDVGLLRWRRWTLLGAGFAVACLVISFYTLPGGNRDPQFMPVPTLELPKELLK